jgi:hypothetical protein
VGPAVVASAAVAVMIAVQAFLSVIESLCLVGCA